MIQFTRIFSIFCLLIISTAAQSSSRHALVIGNSEYGSGHRLVNPLHDSTAIAGKLSTLGYKVHQGGALLDLDLEDFNAAIDSFLISVEPGSSTLIYYAGHGAASQGSNYLIPILPDGVILRSESDIRDRSISLHGILERVERRNPTGVNVLFFDACRDAPVDNYTRSINLTGLANIDPAQQPRGSFIGFSTEYGKLALDDDTSGHSPFASAILAALDQSASTPIELFYKNVTERVYDNTSGQQFPIQESKLRGRHCIVECEETYNTNATVEFGTLSVNTKPLDAEVCYLIDGWPTTNCGKRIVLPLNEDVKITVTAKGHQPYESFTRLASARRQLTVNLEPNKTSTLKVVGGAAAALVVLGLLLSGSDSGSSSTSGDTHTLILERP